MRVEIERQEEKDQTVYKIGTRSFVLPDLTILRQEMAVQKALDAYHAMVLRWSESREARQDFKGILSSVVTEGASILADLWNWAFGLQGSDCIGPVWLRESLTNKGLIRILLQVAKDNELEPVVEFVRGRILPFVLEILVRNARAMADRKAEASHDGSSTI